MNDGAFRAERAAGADGERRGQRLENAHPHANLALADQYGFHRFGNAVALEGRLPKVNHDPDQEAADRGNQDDPCAQMVMYGGGDCKRPLTVKEEVGEKVDQFKQPLSYQAADEPYENGKGGGLENGGIKRLPVLPEPAGIGR